MDKGESWDYFVGLRHVKGESTGYWKELFERLDKPKRWNCFYKIFNLMMRDGQNIGKIAKRFNIPEKYVREVLGRGKRQ